MSDAAKEYMTEEGYDEVMGVRPLRRVVEQQIRDKVTDFHWITWMLNILKQTWKMVSL